MATSGRSDGGQLGVPHLLMVADELGEGGGPVAGQPTNAVMGSAEALSRTIR